MFLSWLRQSPRCGDRTPATVPPPAEGRSSPTNTPVLHPGSFILLSLCGSIYSFPLVRSSCLLSAGVLLAFLSEGVFLMYPWREVYSTSTYSPTILFCNHFPCLWYCFWSLFMVLVQLTINSSKLTCILWHKTGKSGPTYGCRICYKLYILREQENYDLSIVKSCKPLRTIYIR